jgi:hypothetical protein
MDDITENDIPESGSSDAQRGIIITVIVLVVLGISLVGIAVFLASNPQNAGPGVRIIRDLLIIVMALEIIIIGGAFTLFLIQLARLVNLIHNEVEPLLEAASDTVNTVRGTAAFLSKNLVEPVTAVNSTIRGVSKVMGDMDAIRKAAGVVMSASNAMSQPDIDLDDEEFDEPAPRAAKKPAKASKPKTKSTSKKTRSG